MSIVVYKFFDFHLLARRIKKIFDIKDKKINTKNLETIFKLKDETKKSSK